MNNSLDSANNPLVSANNSLAGGSNSLPSHSQHYGINLNHGPRYRGPRLALPRHVVPNLTIPQMAILQSKLDEIEEHLNKVSAKLGAKNISAEEREALIAVQKKWLEQSSQIKQDIENTLDRELKTIHDVLNQNKGQNSIRDNAKGVSRDNAERPEVNLKGRLSKDYNSRMKETKERSRGEGVKIADYITAEQLKKPKTINDLKAEKREAKLQPRIAKPRIVVGR